MLLFETSLVPSLEDDHALYLLAGKRRDLDQAFSSPDFLWPDSCRRQIHYPSLLKRPEYPTLRCRSIPESEFQYAIRKGCHEVHYYQQLVTDHRLGFTSTVDWFLWNQTIGKYQAFLCYDRLEKFCGMRNLDEYMEVCGRSLLMTFRSSRLSRWIHDECLFIYSSSHGPECRMVVRPSRSTRRQDVRRLHRIRALLNGVEFLQVDKHRTNLYPNLKAEYTPHLEKQMGLTSEIQKEKEELSFHLKEVSVLWQCGAVRRCRFRQEKVASWDDPRFLPLLASLLPTSYTTLIHRMLECSRGDQPVLFPPRSVLDEHFPEILKDQGRPWVFVDFETDFQKCIYLCGFTVFDPQTGHRDYSALWGDAIHKDSERRLMIQIQDRLQQHKEAGGRIVYFYAEDRFWRERCQVQTFPPSFHSLFQHQSIDLHRVFQTCGLVVRNVFNFKLKAIAAGLYREGLVPITQPLGCADGAESVKMALDYFQTGDPQLRTILQNYNQFDCDILLEILLCIRQHYH